ncbi:hypothetical protein GPX89_03835 [Nocardia sp. ET3-3]|uniref:Uncharacterized protein n=1 Tax=Nocardia terrae TaxID=2675851 RepID=A0A7K1UPU8_9NOCA|nr:hypothetical protein [Nocardia terrae]MVU76373.1 hypothetical protein [Nocardia terrae]
MRTLLASAAVAGALIAGIGPAAADVPTATQIVGSSDLASGSASAPGSASSAGGGIWNFLCSLGPCSYTPLTVH